MNFLRTPDQQHRQRQGPCRHSTAVPKHAPAGVHDGFSDGLSMPRASDDAPLYASSAFASLAIVTFNELRVRRGAFGESPEQAGSTSWMKWRSGRGSLYPEIRCRKSVSNVLIIVATSCTRSGRYRKTGVPI